MDILKMNRNCRIQITCKNQLKQSAYSPGPPHRQITRTKHTNTNATTYNFQHRKRWVMCKGQNSRLKEAENFKRRVKRISGDLRKRFEYQRTACGTIRRLKCVLPAGEWVIADVKVYDVVCISMCISVNVQQAIKQHKIRNFAIFSGETATQLTSTANNGKRF